jgi:hypothetical protein
MSSVEGVETHSVIALGAARKAIRITVTAARRAGTGSRLRKCLPLATEREVMRTRYGTALGGVPEILFASI